jgi:A/G-specific adenine glycosylase
MCFVLSRYFDVETDIALASAKKVLLAFNWCQKTIHFNQAIMEFGALQCVLKVQIVVFACLTIVVLLQKKESRSAACKI